MRFGQEEAKLAVAAKIPPRASFQSSFNLYQRLRRRSDDDGRQFMHIGSLLVAHLRACTNHAMPERMGATDSGKEWQRRKKGTLPMVLAKSKNKKQNL
jgi:hypothetical protein